MKKDKFNLLYEQIMADAKSDSKDFYSDMLHEFRQNFFTDLANGDIGYEDNINDMSRWDYIDDQDLLHLLNVIKDACAGTDSDPVIVVGEFIKDGAAKLAGMEKANPDKAISEDDVKASLKAFIG